MSIQHNLAAMNASGQYKITTGNRSKSTEKLSSGYRINRAADDAAGLAISEKMRRQIKGLNQASRNIQDGISFVQSADGYLNEMHSVLQRINELAVQSANGTNEETDRAYLDQEVQQLKQETKRVFKSADFNENKIWEMPYLPEIELIPDVEPDIQVYNDGMNPDGTPKWGGVEINHVRHTWDELGVQFNEDGTFKGGTERNLDGSIKEIPEQIIEFPIGANNSDYTGDRVVLKMEEGKRPPEISRNYKWTVEEDGIYVNNNGPISWSDVRDGKGNSISEPVETKEYSFTYSNMKISFTPAKGDTTIKDVIEGIKGSTLRSYYTWDLGVSAKAAPVQAVQTWGKRQLVTEANKDIIDNDYVVRANENRVTLQEEDGEAHLVKKWGHTEEDFNATRGADEFPITDWGTTEVDGK
ncbi:MAG: flagellin [Lachnospiraceae bacterium]|nr:flagellin [Lachnospiraceae bacterium]